MHSKDKWNKVVAWVEHSLKQGLCEQEAFSAGDGCTFALDVRESAAISQPGQSLRGCPESV